MLDEGLKRAGKNKKSRVAASGIRQFTGFLKARATSVGKANRRHSDGIHSLAALLQCCGKPRLAPEEKLSMLLPRWKTGVCPSPSVTDNIGQA